jgi:hydrogenase-4 membrane subunit HyfE
LTEPGVLRGLADLLVVFSLALLVVRPALWSIGLLAAQAAVLAALTFVAVPGAEAWVGAGVIVATKVVAIPLVLRFVARRTGSENAVDWPSPWSWLAGAGIVLLVRLASPAFTAGLNPEHAALLGTSLLVLLLGLAGMVSGRLLLAQAVHLVVIENGLYCAGLALTGGLPAALELGTAVDLLLVVFVLSWLSRHVHRLQLPLHVDELRRLKG